MERRQKKKSGKGNWGAFIKLFVQLRLPWTWIIITFLVNLLYENVLADLPYTVSNLFSGNLTSKALTSAIMYYVLQGVLVTLMNLFLILAQGASLRNSRRTVWRKMMGIKMVFYDMHSASDLSSSITNDLSIAVKSGVNEMVMLIPQLYYVFKVMIRLYEYDFLLLLSILILVPVQLAYTVFYGRWSYMVRAGINQKIGGLTGYLSERVKNLSVIKYYNTEEQELEHGRDISRELFDANMRQAKVECVSTGISTLITLIQSVVIVVFGTLLLRNGRITMAEWVAFFMYAQSLTSKISTMVTSWVTIKTVQGSVERVIQLTEAPQEESRDSGLKEIRSGDIVFEDVDFAYGTQQVLFNINVTIPKGKFTAIVGECGSGKTTMLSLIEKFYQVTEGRILVAGENIDDFGIREYRKNYSYVEQDAGVFSGSIREILTYGIFREVDDDTLIDVCRKARAYDFICEMPEGLDSVINVNGSSLSGGQKQRLVIARELLKDAPYLLLDEATSALDAKTANGISTQIKELFSDRTIIMISHTLRQVTDADQIIVLDKGYLKGVGTHEELLKNCPVYNGLVSRQSEVEG